MSISDKKIFGALNVNGNVSANNLVLTGDIYKNNSLYSTSNWLNENVDVISYTKGNVIIKDSNTINITTSSIYANTYSGANLNLSGNIYQSSSFSNVSSDTFTSAHLQITNISSGSILSTDFKGESLLISNISTNSLNTLTIQTSAFVNNNLCTGDNLSVSLITTNNLLVLNNVNNIANNLVSNNITTGNLKLTSISVNNLISINSSNGNINITGDIYKGDNLYSLSTWKKTGQNNIFYSGGNIGITNSTPAYEIDITDGEVYSNTLQSQYVINNIEFTTVSTFQFRVAAIDKYGNLWISYTFLGNESSTIFNLIPAFINVSLINGPLYNKKIISVACGNLYVMAIDSEGDLWVWGKNNYGQLGIGNTTDLFSATKVDRIRFNNKKVTKVYASDASSFAINEDGNLFAWGKNDAGQLGDGTLRNRLSPLNIFAKFTVSGNIKKIKDVSIRYSTTFAIDEDGNVWGWGQNSEGEIGDGTLTNRREPFYLSSQAEAKTDITVTATIQDTYVWTQGGIFPRDVYYFAFGNLSNNLWVTENENLFNDLFINNGRLVYNGPNIDNAEITISFNSNNVQFFQINLVRPSGGGGGEIVNANNVSVTIINNLNTDDYISISYEVQGSRPTPQDFASIITNFSVNIFKKASGLINIKEISTSITSTTPRYTHTLAIDEDGSVLTWGSNLQGQLGIGTLLTPSVQTTYIWTSAGIYPNDYYYFTFTNMSDDLWVIDTLNDSGRTIPNGRLVYKGPSVDNTELIISFNSNNVQFFNIILEVLSPSYSVVSLSPNTNNVSITLVTNLKPGHYLRIYYQVPSGNPGSLIITDFSVNLVYSNFITPINLESSKFSNRKIIKVNAGLYYSNALDELGEIWSWGSNQRAGIGNGQITTNLTADVRVPLNISTNPYNNFNNNKIVFLGNTLVIDQYGNIWYWGVYNIDGVFIPFQSIQPKSTPLLVNKTKDIIFDIGVNNLGIGTSNPQYKLDVNGDIYIKGSLIVVSDSRLKNSVSTIENAIEKISKINGVSYTINEYSNNIGFIAQDVEEIIPEVVSNNGNYKNINYDGIIPFLVESLKELSHRIDKLQN